MPTDWDEHGAAMVQADKISSAILDLAATIFIAKRKDHTKPPA